LSAPETLIDQYYAALQAGERTKLAGMLTADMAVDYYGPKGLFAWQGHWAGEDGFFAFLDAVADNLNITQVTPLQRIFSNDSAIIVLEGEWTLRATGKQVRAVVANIFTLRGSQISRYQVFTDTAAFGIGLGKLCPASS